ncbi:NAD-dependent epimerase/dehydratase family protein [Pleionea litopenaei]|uniref:NAD-dependent epimerase/dehydratase family protein n=1 Tax=Pleionea litopenaei TaxID=3070815 RepID=A0AA51X5A4_9GAMM|nr:NAD-dependent epimerase/dehydratase family protein [Pleionea sp. HL-JVS1]WMS85643.1 NAD-dependent epimerase/dehydratase family protein [Pleionea sp. HL-JVS1]
MQTILGANGQIGTELARTLHNNYTEQVRVVSRSPIKINDNDQVVSADLRNPIDTLNAIKGSEVAYLTAGLPLNTRMWQEQWPIIMQNVIGACITEQVKLVFFDNTYMYPQTNEPQDETMRFEPSGPKGKVRAQIATMLLEAMHTQRLSAMICRAPEFYGPGRTQSITNVSILEKLKARQRANVFLRDDTFRTLIFTPDASRAMALLGNTEDAYQQTWHLPCDDNRQTYRQLIKTSEEILGLTSDYRILSQWQLKLVGLFNQTIKETIELLPRYSVDNIFLSSKFKERFPDFAVTTYQRGLEQYFNDDI